MPRYNDVCWECGEQLDDDDGDLCEECEALANHHESSLYGTLSDEAQEAGYAGD